MSNEGAAVAMSPLEQLEAASKVPPRRINWYTLPADVLPFANGTTRIGIVELTTGEELMATKRARGDVLQFAMEMAIESLRYVEQNGTKKRLLSADGTADVWWGQAHPKVRGLVVVAHNNLHQPDRGDVAAFLGSQEICVG